MEKIVTVPQSVDDLGGLLIDLKRGGFAVRNVGSDPRCTYVYLEETEDKDPAPVVEAWVGRPAPNPSDRKAYDARMQNLRQAFAPPAPVEVALEAPAEADAAREEGSPPAREPVRKDHGRIRRFVSWLLG